MTWSLRQFNPDTIFQMNFGLTNKRQRLKVSCYSFPFALPSRWSRGKIEFCRRFERRLQWLVNWYRGRTGPRRSFDRCEDREEDGPKASNSCPRTFSQLHLVGSKLNWDKKWGVEGTNQVAQKSSSSAWDYIPVVGGNICDSNWHVGQTKPLMFSMTPIIGRPTLRQKLISFRTSSNETWWKKNKGDYYASNLWVMEYQVAEKKSTHQLS